MVKEIVGTPITVVITAFEMSETIKTYQFSSIKISLLSTNTILLKNSLSLQNLLIRNSSNDARVSYISKFGILFEKRTYRVTLLIDINASILHL